MLLITFKQPDVPDDSNDYVYDSEYFSPDYRAKRWYNKEGLFHRIGKPAIIFDNGDKFWYENGKLHRDDGPACEYADGRMSWYYHGVYQKTIPE